MQRMGCFPHLFVYWKGDRQFILQEDSVTFFNRERGERADPRLYVDWRRVFLFLEE